MTEGGKWKRRMSEKFKIVEERREEERRGEGSKRGRRDLEGQERKIK